MASMTNNQCKSIGHVKESGVVSSQTEYFYSFTLVGLGFCYSM